MSDLRRRSVAVAIMSICLLASAAPWTAGKGLLSARSAVRAIPGAMSGTGVGAEDRGMADYLGYQGIYYHQNGCNYCAQDGVGRTVEVGDLDHVVARVEAGRDPWAGTSCADGSDDPVEAMTASALPLGTEVWAVAGHDPRFRLAVVSDGAVLTYEANCGPSVVTGADLFDFTTLERIEVRTGGHSGRLDLLAAVSDPAEVVAWADEIERAPAPSWNDPNHIKWDSQSTVTIVFFFADGTASSRNYDRETRVLDPLMQLPEATHARIEALVATGTPIASPAV